MDESKAMQDLNARIQQLTKLILTSQTVDELKGGDGDGEDEDTTATAPESPAKVDFDMSPYQVWGSPWLVCLDDGLMGFGYSCNNSCCQPRSRLSLRRGRYSP